MTQPTPEAVRRECDQWLTSLLGSPHLVDRWWQGPNAAFEMQTPEQVFQESPDRVRDYLRQF
jgi:hypothetical protein